MSSLSEEMLGLLPRILPRDPLKAMWPSEVVHRLRPKLSNPYLASAIEGTLERLCQSEPGVVARAGPCYYSPGGERVGPRDVPFHERETIVPGRLTRTIQSSSSFAGGGTLYAEVCDALRRILPTAPERAMSRVDVLLALGAALPTANRGTLKGYLHRAATTEAEFIRTANGSYLRNAREQSATVTVVTEADFVSEAPPLRSEAVRGQQSFKARAERTWRPTQDAAITAPERMPRALAPAPQPMMAAAHETPRRRGRPPGSRNKKRPVLPEGAEHRGPGRPRGVGNDGADTLKNQLVALLPRVLPRNPRDALNGPKLVALLEPLLSGSYSPATIRGSLSFLAGEQRSPIARLVNGHGYFLRQVGGATTQPAAKAVRAQPGRDVQLQQVGLALPDELLASLSSDERRVLSILGASGSARTSELARALGRTPVRLNGFMRRLRRSLHDAGFNVLRDEGLADGEVLYHLVPQGRRR